MRFALEKLETFDTIQKNCSVVFWWKVMINIRKELIYFIDTLSNAKSYSWFNPWEFKEVSWFKTVFSAYKLPCYVNQYQLFNCPLFIFYSLHLGIQSGPCEDELIRLDEAYVQNKYKVSTYAFRERSIDIKIFRKKLLGWHWLASQFS